MFTECAFHCGACGKEFKIKGYWWNQMIFHQWIDWKFMWHNLIFHKKKVSSELILHMLKMTLLWIPLIPLQIIDILLQPLRWIT